MWKNLPNWAETMANIAKSCLIEEVNRKNQFPNIGLGGAPELIINQSAVPDPESNGLLVPPTGIEE